MAGEKIMFGRVVGFSVTPHAGTFPGSLTYVTICAAELPEVGQVRPEQEITNSCSTAEEYIAGLAQGTEVSITGFWQGASSTDFGGTSGTTLIGLAAAGATIGIKDNFAQFANPIVLRYDLALLEWKFLGGNVKDPQKVMIRGRITGTINRATS